MNKVDEINSKKTKTGTSHSSFFESKGEKSTPISKGYVPVKDLLTEGEKKEIESKQDQIENSQTQFSCY